MDQTKEKPLHFKGKDALEHVIEARLKGRAASSEIHGAELPGHYSAAADTAKETSWVLLILWILFSVLSVDKAPWIATCFLVGWILWKVGRSAILGYSRLERLHRLIEEERWEIEHHRGQEREELKALYVAKGFQGKLLEESIDVLMADDNRLLQVMLEEELGVSLESYEHPLKQALGAFAGALFAGIVMGLFVLLFSGLGAVLGAALAIALASGFAAKFEKNNVLHAIIWNLSSAALAAGALFFTAQIFVKS